VSRRRPRCGSLQRPRLMRQPQARAIARRAPRAVAMDGGCREKGVCCPGRPPSAAARSPRGCRPNHFGNVRTKCSALRRGGGGCRGPAGGIEEALASADARDPQVMTEAIADRSRRLPTGASCARSSGTCPLGRSTRSPGPTVALAMVGELRLGWLTRRGRARGGDEHDFGCGGGLPRRRPAPRSPADVSRSVDRWPIIG